MDVCFPRCCGLDVHKRVVVACIRLLDASGCTEMTRSFGTTVAALRELAAWVTAHGCTHVAMESTGVYWRPVYHVLEGVCTLWVVNAQHLKQVPGRKTDVRDAAWIAQLLQYGLVRPSFVPTGAQRALRDLTRSRARRVQERVRVINRLHKMLELGNIKLAAVISDITGKTGRAILDGLVAGVTDVVALANRAVGRARVKRAELAEALAGTVTPTQRLVLQELLTQLDQVDASIGRYSAAVVERTAAWSAAFARLQTIPGVGQRLAEVILAEVGIEELATRFPTAARLVAWAGLCPGLAESAGKRRATRTRPGNPWLKQALIEAAQAAARSQTYLGARYHRIARRRGRKKAIIAIAHSLLEIAYYVLTREEDYRDLGANYFDERDRQAVTHRMVRRLQNLGYEVTLTVAEAA